MSGRTFEGRGGAILGSLSWRCFKGTPGAVASFSFWNLSTLSVEQERLGHMQGKVRL